MADAARSDPGCAGQSVAPSQPAGGGRKPIDSALSLARRGFRVVPLHTPAAGGCSCGKPDCGNSTGKHPRMLDWQRLASTDEVTIRNWFQRWPASNVGIAMGAQPGDKPPLVALDIDGPRGRETLAQLEQQAAPLPPTLTIRSGRVDGGEHRIFRVPTELDIAAIKNRVGSARSRHPGVDVRGEGSQIVAPDSLHYSGRRYEWGDGGPDAAIAELPSWVYDLLTAKDEPPTGSLAPATSGDHADRLTRARAYLEKIEGAHDGQQGGTNTFIAAMKVGVGFDLSEEECFQLLWEIFNPKCVPPWSEKDLRRKVNQAYTQGTFERGRLLREELRDADFSSDTKSSAREYSPAGPQASEAERTSAKASEGSEQPATPQPPIDFARERRRRGIPNEGSELPAIRISLDVDRVVRSAIDHLAEADDVYSRGGMLVRVVGDERDKRIRRDAGAPTIKPHTAATIDRALSTVCRFESAKKDSDGNEKLTLCGPPPKIIANLLEASAWPGLRPLAGVASAPILRADGSIADAPGYDQRSGYLLAFDPLKAFAVGNAPSKLEALGSRDALLDLVRDFPFQADADRAAWLGLVLTLLARAAIDGPCPMWLVTANVRGAGKGRLVDVASIIATGREASRATQPVDDAEAGKLITSIVLAGDDFALFDNIDRPLGGSKLDALLTGARWKDRVLGSNLTIDLPIRTVLAATGNNVELRGDTHRRVLPIRLDSPHEHPEERRDFTIADLLGHVRHDRPRLVGCALTTLRGWFAAGCPKSDARPWGSYEAWAALVPHVLRWIDLPDPQETRVDLEADDPHLRALAAVLAHWPTLEKRCGAIRGVTIHEALARLYPNGRGPDSDDLDELRAAIEWLAPGRGAARVDGRVLGNTFRRARGRVVDGSRLVEAGAAHGVKRWTVTMPGGSGGTGGSVSS